MAEAIQESVLAAVAALNAQQPDLQISYRLFRPDGAVIWVQRDSRAYFDVHGKMLRVVGMEMEITERRRIEQELHRISYQLLRSQDTERRNMARELHESVGQTLAALKMTVADVDILPGQRRGRSPGPKGGRDLIEDPCGRSVLFPISCIRPCWQTPGLGWLCIGNSWTPNGPSNHPSDRKNKSVYRLKHESFMLLLAKRLPAAGRFRLNGDLHIAVRPAALESSAPIT